MINAIFRRIAGASIALCTTAMFQIAHAELGGTATFTQSANKTTRPAEQTGLFRVRSTIDDGGTTINEYASTSGQVFAYTWQGPTMPDLQTLLGKYYDSYRVGATPDATTPRNLHASRVTRPDVIVESGGQMRNYAGRAWLPGALPAGVFADDLR